MLHCLLGQAYFRAGNRTEAARSLAASLQLDPDNRVAKELLQALQARRLSMGS